MIARAASLSDRTTGLWAGLSIREVARVVAAAGAVSAAALSVAVVAKLARVVLHLVGGLTDSLHEISGAGRGRRHRRRPRRPA